ncbi:MAG TPA: flippase-like domain-containing protein, partial [Anaerolineae bacterium]
MFVAAVGLFVLFPQIIGYNRAINLLRHADPRYLGIALVAEALRYVTSAGSTYILSWLFECNLPFEPLTETFFAGGAANRTFSTGGAPGMLIRLLFLTGQGITAGTVAVIFLIEDIAGLLVGSLVLVLGIVVLVNAQPSNHLIANFALVFSVGLLAIGAAFICLSHHRTWVERGVHAAARACNAVVAWLTGRSFFTPDRVQKALGEFYIGMSIGVRAPLFVLATLALNLLRYAGGIAALYFCFLSLGWSVEPGILILLYTSASVISTISAVPG